MENGDVKIHCKYQELKPISTLKKHPKNANKHPTDQVQRLSEIIKYQGLRAPIVVSNLSGRVVKGHGTLEAIKKLGVKEAPVVFQDFDDEDQEIAFLHSDNAIASWSDLDLSFINEQIADFDPSFNIDLLGLKDFELEPADKYQTDPDEIPEVDKKNVKTKLGDLYELGNHRLLCGDSTDKDTVDRLMVGQRADVLHTDPPYNVNYSNQDRPKAGKVDLGRIDNDSMSDSDFKKLLNSSLSCAYDSLNENASAYIWYASKESVNFIQATESAGFVVNQQIIWKKPMLLGRGKYQWAHEPCIFALKGKPYFTDDRTKTTVWDFGGYDKSKNVHPTQKPIILPEEAINNSSQKDSLVLDIFGGSGSTLIACEKTNRKCFMMELDPYYCDVIVSRWCKFTGQNKIKLNGKEINWGTDN